MGEGWGGGGCWPCVEAGGRGWLGEQGGPGHLHLHRHEQARRHQHSGQCEYIMGSIVRCEYDYKIILFGHTTQHFSEGLLT